jgi:hypothetical protein
MRVGRTVSMPSARWSARTPPPVAISTRSTGTKPLVRATYTSSSVPVAASARPLRSTTPALWLAGAPTLRVSLARSNVASGEVQHLSGGGNKNLFVTPTRGTHNPVGFGARRGIRTPTTTLEGSCAAVTPASRDAPKYTHFEFKTEPRTGKPSLTSGVRNSLGNSFGNSWRGSPSRNDHQAPPAASRNQAPTLSAASRRSVSDACW